MRPPCTVSAHGVLHCQLHALLCCAVLSCLVLLPIVLRSPSVSSSVCCHSPGCQSRELWQVLALLYKGQGRPDLSLAIYLQLQLPSVFDFIQEHGLLLCLDRNAYLLMAIDERRALELLTAHLDTLPPGKKLFLGGGGGHCRSIS